MSGQTAPSESENVVGQAALMVARATDGGNRDGAALADWVGNDTVRRQAVARIERAWRLFDGLDNEPSLAQLRDDANALLASRSRSGMRHSYAAIAACCALFLLSGLLTLGQRSETYRFTLSAPSGPKAFRLNDGSKVTLDIGSQIDVAFSDLERRLTIRAGQARFAVAHDARRPFYVMALGHEIQDIGTDFNVDTSGRRLLVSLIEGKVDVAKLSVEKRLIGFSLARVRKNPIRIEAGQQLDFATTDRPMPKPFNLAEITAWEGGTVVLNNRSLADAANTLSRYARIPVRVDHSVPTDLTISGRLRAADGEAFAANAIALYPTLSIRRTAEAIYIVNRAK